MSDTFVFIPRGDQSEWGYWINMSHVSHITVTPTVVTLNIGNSVINISYDDGLSALNRYLLENEAQ